MKRDRDAAAIRMAVAAMASASAALPRDKSICMEGPYNFFSREGPYFREINWHERRSHGYGDSGAFKDLNVIVRSRRTIWTTSLIFLRASSGVAAWVTAPNRRNAG